MNQFDVANYLEPHDQEVHRPEVKRLHCKACNWILPGIYNWEWEPDDEERRVVFWIDCWRCGERNRL